MNVPDFRGVAADFREQQALEIAAERAHEDDLRQRVADAAESAAFEYDAIAGGINRAKGQVFEEDAIVLLYALRQQIKKRSHAMHDQLFVGVIEKLDDQIFLLSRAVEERARQRDEVEA